MPYAVAVVQEATNTVVVIIIDAPTPAAALDVAKSRGFQLADDSARLVVGTGVKLASPANHPAFAAQAAATQNPHWWTIARGVWVGMVLAGLTGMVLSCILWTVLGLSLAAVGSALNNRTPAPGTGAKPALRGP